MIIVIIIVIGIVIIFIEKGSLLRLAVKLMECEAQVPRRYAFVILVVVYCYLLWLLISSSPYYYIQEF